MTCAEAVGFEPTVTSLPRRFSRPFPSAARASLPAVPEDPGWGPGRAGDSLLGGVADAGAEGDGRGVGGAVAGVDEGGLVLGLVLPDLADEGLVAVDDRVVELGDHVAGLETGQRAGAAGLDGVAGGADLGAVALVLAVEADEHDRVDRLAG